MSFILIVGQEIEREKKPQTSIKLFLSYKEPQYYTKWKHIKSVSGQPFILSQIMVFFSLISQLIILL